MPKCSVWPLDLPAVKVDQASRSARTASAAGITVAWKSRVFAARAWATNSSVTFEPGGQIWKFSGRHHSPAAQTHLSDFLKKYWPAAWCPSFKYQFPAGPPITGSSTRAHGSFMGSATPRMRWQGGASPFSLHPPRHLGGRALARVRGTRRQRLLLPEKAPGLVGGCWRGPQGSPEHHQGTRTTARCIHHAAQAECHRLQILPGDNARRHTKLDQQGQQQPANYKNHSCLRPWILGYLAFWP
jgi:hypothetical protein